MQITTFFIDRFKEVSLQTPEGFQEEFGVYGLEEEYSPWQLGQEGDTADFLGVSRTNILYGELFRITLDTANLFNPTVPGGMPNINGFRNMNLDDYWFNVTEGIFKFNGLDYRTLIKPQKNQLIYPSLIEYANIAKQKVGWVEVNRTRASIYYEICSDGKSKRARSDHFYDIDKFIMTPDLFNPEDEFQIGMFQYSFINPYRATQAAVAAGFMQGENFVTINTITPFSPIVGGQQVGLQRIGLMPVDSWFTWQNTQQGHTRTIKNIPDGANNGGFFDMFPWPSGPVEISQALPQNYLKLLVTGNKRVLDATIDDGPTIVTQKVPSGLGDLNRDVPLLLASKENHLNLLMGDRLTIPTQFGIPNPISPVYSVDIWGERRIPENVGVIPVGIKSTVQTPSVGVCQSVQGLDEKVTTTRKDVTIIDPFGLELYDLDKEYKEVYDKFKSFCPPRKKIKHSLSLPTSSFVNTNPNQTVKVSTSVGNVEEYNIGKDIKVIKIGNFNPDESLIIDTKLKNFVKSEIDNNGNKKVEITYNRDVITNVESKIHKNYEFEEREEEIPVFFIERRTDVIDISKENRSEDLYRAEIEYIKTAFNSDEVALGLRDPMDFLTTSPDVPYGTYKHIVEKKFNENGDLESSVIKIMRNGADADPGEFNKSVSEILKISGNNKKIPNPLGVHSSGMPIYPNNTLEESINKIKEQLTGVKEIIFRGSEVDSGVLSVPKMSDPINTNPDETVNYFPIAKREEYVNTGIFVSNTVDLDTGNKSDMANSYYHRIFSFVNSKNGPTIDFMKSKTKNLEKGCIDFIGNYDNWKTYPHRPPVNPVEVLRGVTHILVSKYDMLGAEKKHWAPTSDNQQLTEILTASSGTLFLEEFPNAGDAYYAFNIVGKPTLYNPLITPYDSFYSIPVKLIEFEMDYKTIPGSKSYDSNKKTTSFRIYYSNKVSRVSLPSLMKLTSSPSNTYGGWLFSGLWHRSGRWPLEHKYRAGLLSSGWIPPDGAVETGAWIKVNPERVRLEFHDFGIHSKDTVYSYIHQIWLSKKNEEFVTNEFKNNNIDINSPLDIQNNMDKISEIFGKLQITMEEQPGFKKEYEPSDKRINEWTQWENILSIYRSNLIKTLKSIPGKVLIIRLRDNNADPSRMLPKISFKIQDEQTKSRYQKEFGTSFRGHLPEDWIQLVPTITPDMPESILDSKFSYTFRRWPEPTDHCYGTFKKDEWYRAVFTRAITSPTNPYGDLAGKKATKSFTSDDFTSGRITTREFYNNDYSVGRYKANEQNKKTFCDLLYVSEQLLKMHRARLKSIREYVNKRQDFYGEKDSSGNYLNPSFSNQMRFVKLFREFLNNFKR